ncbi:helix-turn-helix domain-containing protein [Pedobacter sp. P26]
MVKQFNEGNKISQLAKLHGRSYGAIKARLIKLEIL